MNGFARRIWQSIRRSKEEEHPEIEHIFIEARSVAAGRHPIARGRGPHEDDGFVKPGRNLATHSLLHSLRQFMVSPHSLSTSIDVRLLRSARFRMERGFFRRLFVSLAFTLGAVLGFIAVVVLGIAVPVALAYLSLGNAAEIVVLVLRWVLLWSIAVFGLAVVYRFAPDRNRPRWSWVSWGSAIAATLWLAGSLLFALYVREFGSSYGETHGALGGVVVMLLWFLLSAYLIILGAEINSEMERQTTNDTTDGTPKPMGERGAYSADTLGAAS